MTDLVQRVERIERLLGVGGDGGANAGARGGAAGAAGTTGAAGAAGAGGATGAAGSGGAAGAAEGAIGDAQGVRPGPEAGSLGAWVRSHKRPGNVVVGIAVSARDGGVATAHHVFERPNVPFDLRHTAGVCQALASEVRLAMLRELFGGERSTAELMAAVGLDRGQLYHHLRDLFVQGLVRQPVRGRYVLTSRGTCIFLGAGIATTLGGAEGPSVPFEPDEPPAAPAPRGADAPAPAGDVDGGRGGRPGESA